jgi:hypothetical protein
VVGVIVVVVVRGGTIIIGVARADVDVEIHTSTAMAALIAISVARTKPPAAFSVLHLKQNPLGIGSLASGR